MTTGIKRLLTDNDTLYGQPPDWVAEAVKGKLNELTREGWSIRSVNALPDYHNFGDDGGVKDILFLVSKEEQEQVQAREWFTTLTISAKSTMYGEKTPSIVSWLEARIDEVEKDGFVVEFIVPLTDHHQSAIFQGAGGFDGTKNIILCGRKRHF